MSSNCTASKSYRSQTRGREASIPARISTKTLENALFVLNATMGAISLWRTPQAAPALLAGGIFGAVVRQIVGDNHRATSAISERQRRSNSMALMCLNTLVAVHAGQTPASCDSLQCSIAPFFVGFQAAANGLYPIARKVMG